MAIPRKRCASLSTLAQSALSLGSSGYHIDLLVHADWPSLVANNGSNASENEGTSDSCLLSLKAPSGSGSLRFQEGEVREKL